VITMAKIDPSTKLGKTLLAVGLKEWVKTATDEEIAGVIANTKLGHAAMDEGESEGADEDEHPKGCRCADCMDKGKDAKDAKSNDARERLYRTIDKLMDAQESGKQEEQEALDADMETLRGLLAGGAGAEKTKDTPGVDEKEEVEEEAEGNDEEEEKVEAEDEAVQSEASPELKEGQRAKSPAPSAVDAATVIKALKPFAARSTDKAFKSAFDTAAKLVKGTAGTGKGSYSAVARAAAATGKDAQEQLDKQRDKASEEANAAYKTRHRK
jgi:hypothetical protein